MLGVKVSFADVTAGLTKSGRSAFKAVCGLFVAFAAVLALAAPDVDAAVTYQSVGNFDDPMELRSDPADPERLFIAERAGRIWMWHEGAKSLVVDFSDLVSPVANEEGFLSFALHPRFAINRKLYVWYTTPNTGGFNNFLQVDEFTMDGNVAPLASRRPVISIPHPDSPFHNAGQLQFGPDGYLYISTGDGGHSFTNGQGPNSLLSKILRIDPLQNGGDPYTVPDDNPFFDSGSVLQRPEIWSWGFRNPWRFSFDRLTGDLFVGDVGDIYEEINYRPAPDAGRGINFGWPCREGMAVKPGAPGECAGVPWSNTYVDAVHGYPTGGNPYRCAIVPGVVVRDPALDDLYGRFLYGDWCVNVLRSVSLTGGSPTGDRAEGEVPYWNLVSISQDGCGRVYVMGANNEVHRMVGSTPSVCEPVEPNDDDAPQVSASLDPAEPDGENDWYVTAPELTIEAEDENGGSGVSAILYRVDNGPSTVYNGPVTLHLADGEHSVSVSAVDHAGNHSAWQDIDVNIDLNHPDSRVSLHTGTDCPGFATDGFCPVQVTLTSADPGNGAGVDGYFLSVLPEGQPFVPGPFAGSVDPALITDQGRYTVYFHARDAAGNVEAVRSRPLVVGSLLPGIKPTKPLRKLTKKNRIFEVACPEAAFGDCTVQLPAKVKPKVKLKGSKKQRKAARKQAKKKFKVRGPKRIVPGSSARFELLVSKKQCEAFGARKMRVRVDLTMKLTVPGGAVHTERRSDRGMVCGSTSHF